MKLTQRMKSPEYEAEIRGYRLISSRACAVVVAVLILFGVVLDYALYPELTVKFAVARMMAAGFVLFAYALLHAPFGERNVQSLTFIWLLTPQVMIAWMIYVTQGEASLFYAGLILTVFAIGSLFPVGYWHTLAYGAVTLALYASACWLRPGGVQNHGQFLFHSVIVLFAVAGSTVFTFYNERNRQQMFRLKQELAQSNQALAKNNADLAEIKGQMLQQEKMAAVGTLAAGLLHEVNNPVNFCLMAIEIAIEEPAAASSASVMECLTDAKQGMQRIQAIVSDLKTFAYRTPGELPQHMPFLFEKALDSAVRLTGHELKGMTISRVLPIDTLVVGDEAAIVGVLINLLSNAAMELRRSQHASPTITVLARWEGKRLRVTVEDNGSGIPAENLSRVFDPFFTTREVGQGLGLGLSISYRVIEQHGGVLYAESMQGAWTKMQFDLAQSE